MGHENAGITRSAARVGAATMLSRVFGLARDTAFAVLFGTSFVADAFNLAFLIPNVFRRVVGEGNLNPAFVPVFTRILERDGEEAAGRFLRRAAGLLCVVLVGLVAVGMLAAGPLVHLYAHDWKSAPEDFRFAVGLLRLLFPSLLFAGLAALATAALNARRRFVVAALSPIVLNLGFLIGAAAAVPFASLTQRAVVFSIGGLLGGLAAWLVQLPTLRKSGLPIGVAWEPRDSEVLRVARLMGPGIIALGVVQLNLFVDTILALRLEEGSLSAMRLANRLVLLPMGVVGVAVSTASLPTLASQAAAEDRRAAVGTLAHSLKLLVTLLVPAAVGLILLARPIVTLLFQYGAFTAERSTPMTADTLVFYALGLPAFGLVRGLSQGFYSVQDTKTPVKIATAGMIVNVVLDVVLMIPLGLRGLALATSIAAWMNVWMSWALLRRHFGEIRGTGLWTSVVRVALASGALAAACVLGITWTAPLGDGVPARVAQVAVPMVLGIAALLGASFALRHHEMREILESLPGRGRRR
ncbi:MAG: murein biosynthesis integral membrane protein MurJ [Gemmatimonadetes bacterium]|nr:murein biosynthesis integral membrane protein MurJ [Gemmatimonadota bacterium]